MGWIVRRCKHALVIAALSTTVVVTTTATVPAVAGPRVPGIDVSKYQGRIDWRAVATTPVRFAILRATLGNEYRDRRYARNHAGARANGIVAGAYHFAKPSLARWDARAEADHFLAVARVAAGDIIPVLDIEETGGLSPRQLRTWAGAWLERVHERTGVRAMIYSGNHFWHGSMRNTPWFGRLGHPLWVAHWYVRAPQVPGSRWAGSGYTIWQWSATGRVAGIRGPVDLDRIRGNLARATVASIDVHAVKGGVISGDRLVCGRRLRRCTRLANPGDRLTLAATPGPGSRLIRWTGACASAGKARTCTVIALRTRTVSAVFGQPKEAAIPDAGDEGTPTPAASPTARPSPSGGSTTSANVTSRPRRAARACDDTDCTVAALVARQLEIVAKLGARPSPSPTPVGEGDGTRYSWSRERDRGAIGGSYRWERRATASISFAFRGRTVTLYTIKGRGMGKAHVSIDGERVKTIDGYASRVRARVRHRFTRLGAGSHVLTIAPLGRKRPAAKDGRVVVDALRWGGRLHPDPAPRAASWAEVEDPSASDGTYVVTDAPGAQAKLSFSGASLSLRTLRGPAKGRAKIWVDGRHVRTIDLYAPTRRYASIPVASGLADGPHVARIVVLGTHRPASEGSVVAIDRWIVAYRPERGRLGSAGSREIP